MNHEELLMPDACATWKVVLIKQNMKQIIWNRYLKGMFDLIRIRKVLFIFLPSGYGCFQTDPIYTVFTSESLSQPLLAGTQRVAMSQ